MKRNSRGGTSLLKANEKYDIMKIQINTTSCLTRLSFLSFDGMVKKRKTQRTRYLGRVLRCVRKLMYGSQGPPSSGLFVVKKII